MNKTVRRSKASAGKASAIKSTPIDGVGQPADALERRAKKKAARRKVRRARERLSPIFPPPPFSGDAAIWSAAGIVIGAFAKKFVGPVIDKMLANQAAEPASDEGLLDVAAASLGKIRLEPVCCFTEYLSAYPAGPKPPCGQPAPRYFARKGGAELTLCQEHAERMRSLMPVTDRQARPLALKMYDPEKKS